jgi:DNA-directed RNA polymerase subunit RPC12/RpoP
MDIQCPSCGSDRIKERNYAQKTLGTIGAIAGASVGIRTVLHSGRLGMKLGMVAGPTGGVAGMLVGSIFGALVSGSLGCELGAAVGKRVDQSILNNYVCCDCECAFSKDLNPSQTEELLSYHSS